MQPSSKTHKVQEEKGEENLFPEKHGSVLRLSRRLQLQSYLTSEFNCVNNRADCFASQKQESVRHLKHDQSH